MSWHYLPELAAGCSEADCSAGEPSAPWKKSRTVERCSSDASATVCSTCSQSGMTSAPSTAGRGVKSWISSLRASRANRSRKRSGRTSGRKTKETCGPKRSGSFAKWDPATCSWRTSQICFGGTLEPFSATWPRAGLVIDGTAYTLPPWAPIIDEIDCGLWPTPAARDHKGTSSKKWRLDDGSQDTLPDALAETLGIPLDVAIVPSPTFPEKLMQWPITWTALQPLEMDRFQAWLELLGD